MTQALIQINGTTGSNDNLPINTLVQLNNLGNGGEVTWLWALLDKPAGSLATLSATNIQNPTFTPDVEGTYLIQVIVNESLSSEATNTAIAGIRYLKSYQRAPAGGEETQDGIVGWKTAVNAQLQELDNVQAGLTRVVCQSYSGAAVGDVVIFTGTQVIKSGLPGQERVPLIAKALATTGQVMGIIEAACNGGSTSSALVYVRISGYASPSFSGSPSLGATVYLDPSTSQPTLTAQTVTLGHVIYSSGGQWQFFIEGHAIAGGGGGGTQAVVFNDSVPTAKSNIVENRAANQSPIDNTKSQITNLGSQDGTINPSATGATSTGATIGGGDDNTAGPTGYETVAGGGGNTAQGQYATVGGGQLNVASNTGATVSGGAQNQAQSAYSTVRGGYFNYAKGNYAEAGGYEVSASGVASHGEGSQTTASGDYSHAEGDGTTASENAAHAEGTETHASAANAHAEGASTNASAANAHAEGIFTGASGPNSHAEGENSQALAEASHASGFNAGASQFGQRAHSSGTGSTGPYGTGQTQESVVTMSGITPGSVPGESVMLQFGVSATLGLDTLNDNMGYMIVVTAIARGKVSGTYCAQGFRQSYAVLTDGGTPTLVASGAAEQIGSAAAASWTLVASVATGPSQFLLTFTTGTTTALVAVTAKVELVEIYNPN
jgi:hypothetical protein